MKCVQQFLIHPDNETEMIRAPRNASPFGVIYHQGLVVLFMAVDTEQPMEWREIVLLRSDTHFEPRSRVKHVGTVMVPQVEALSEYYGTDPHHPVFLHILVQMPEPPQPAGNRIPLTGEQLQRILDLSKQNAEVPHTCEQPPADQSAQG